MNIEHILNKLDSFKGFANKFRFDLRTESGRKIPLGNHQLLPVYDATENGLRRFFLAYGTGAGKTNIPIQVIKRLKEQGNKMRSIVIAPYQTMLENWNASLLERNGLKAIIHRMEDFSKRQIPDDVDFVVVNYNKLVESGNYHEHLVNFARGTEMVVVDEAHNVKNKNGKRSKGLQEIIEASKGTPDNIGRLIALSASPCPNEPKDLGMVLYMLDPFRFKEYAEQPFVYQKDAAAIWEMREMGQIRFFSKEDVKNFYGLPSFTENVPRNISFLPRLQEDYFEYFVKCFKTGDALNALERTSINAVIQNPEFKEWCKGKLREGYMLNFFSHLRNDERGKMSDKAIFVELERIAKSTGKNVVVRAIHGDISDEERKAIQKECLEGGIDVLINQWKCTSEGFSEVAGYRPVAICPLRSPFDPGTQLQIIGRSWRPGQIGIVEYQEFHPESLELRDRIDEFVREYAESIGQRVRASWFPTLFNKDCFLIRKTKEDRLEIILHQRPVLKDSDTSNKKQDESDEDNRFITSSMCNYAKRLSSSRIVDTTENDESFGKGPRQSMIHIGKNFDKCLKENIEPLAQDYNRANIMLFIPGKINSFLAQYISKIKGSIKEPWKIVDLGCDSSAPFAQARMIYQLASGDKCLDTIVNFDGAEGCVRGAKAFIKKKEWCSVITHENMPSLREDVAQSVREQLLSSDFSNLEFRVGNFVTEEYGKEYNAVITSQSLQYNDQKNNREIEQALIKINHALLPKGHYLAALTANCCETSCTTQQDFENFLKLLKTYNFKVIESDMPEGKIDNKRVMAPFYFVHAIKDREFKGNVLVEENKPIGMYAEEFYVLTGGARPERIDVSGRSKHMKPSPNPTHYFGQDGRKLI